ncbi:MAG TPA: helix-turn-helix transcriptional regulator [Candidatus Peribacteraceae bacterium]|nr:helix-turn-helix transcriptional regulator [Candidatus Peribacteraceae bacterium]
MSKAGQLVRTHYREAGFTQRSLAKDLGLSDKRALQHWMNGTSPFPDGIREKIADLVFASRDDRKNFLELAKSEEFLPSPKRIARDKERYKKFLLQKYEWHFFLAYGTSTGIDIEGRLYSDAQGAQMKARQEMISYRGTHTQRENLKKDPHPMPSELLKYDNPIAVSGFSAQLVVFSKKDKRPNSTEKSNFTDRFSRIFTIDSDSDIGFMYHLDLDMQYPASIRDVIRRPDIFDETEEDQIIKFANFCLRRQINPIMWMEIIRDDAIKSPTFESITYQDRKNVLVDSKEIELWMRAIGDTVLWIRNENSMNALDILHNLRMVHAEMEIAKKSSQEVIKSKGQLLRIIDRTIIHLKNYVPNLHS